MLPLVFLNPEIIASSSICMGMVYIKKDDSSRFCVLPNCNTRSHNNKKASYPDEAFATGCYFISTNSAKSVVWICPFCPKHLVPDSLSSFFYQSNERSFVTWSATFGLIQESAPLDVIQASLASDGTVKVLLAPLIVSKQRQAKTETQPSPPPPFIHQTSLDDWIDSGIPADLVAFLHQTSGSLSKLRSELASSSRSSSTLSSDVASDLKQILGSIILLKSEVGKRSSDSTGHALWQFASACTAQVSLLRDNFDSEIASINNNCVDLKRSMHRIFNFLKRFCGPDELVGDGLNVGPALEQKLVTLDETLQDLSRRLPSISVGSSSSSSQQNDETKALQSRLTFLKNNASFSSSSSYLPSSSDDTISLSLRMDDIVEELKLIVSRMRGEGFVNADNTFLSALDNETWAAIHFKKGHYEYIVDAVSLFSFMPQSEYKHSNDDLDEKSKAAKLGLTNA